MFVGIIILGGVVGFVVAGTSLLFGGSLMTALWLYPVTGIACTLTIIFAKYACGSFKERNAKRHRFITQQKAKLH